MSMATFGSLHAIEQARVSDDSLIVYAIWFDEQQNFARSREVYAELYDRTGLKEYLFREATTALLSNTAIRNTIDRVLKWEVKNPDTLEGKRILIPLYLTIDEGKLALTASEYLLERSGNIADLEIASHSYLYGGNFKRALDLLMQVYEESFNEDILLRIAFVMDTYTNQRKDVIPIIETHLKIHGGSEKVYLALIDFYIKENDISSMLRTYIALFENYPTEEYLQKILLAYAYKQDAVGAMRFLETHHGYELSLYDLYKVNKLYKKAFILADRFYKVDKNPKWLAEKAVLLFEGAKNKKDKKLIKQVINYFEKALKAGVNDSLYLNYYGYTLVDVGYNINKGVSLIERAIKQQPDNIYYLDSLAWGYYKQKRCKKAYKVMKQVVKSEGLDEEEIAMHWKAIKRCGK